jgi:DNA-3-methyladenine glycosylase
MHGELPNARQSTLAKARHGDMNLRARGGLMADHATPPIPRRLTRGELPHDTVALARALIGVCLMHDLPDGPAGVRIVETEAYPVGDAAGHAFVGQTRFNTPMFEDFGRIHVYLGYGVSWLINIAAEQAGVGAGVLFRAGEPLWGIGGMIDRRHRSRLVDLASGPGKLCQALAIDGRQSDGDYFDGGTVWLGPAVRRVGEIGVSRRIGITKDADRPLRFYERGSAFVSGPKRLSP